MNNPPEGTSKTKRISDIVTVIARPTVVRLDDLDRSDSQWIEEGYHQTAEVRQHLAALSAAFTQAHGTGVFVIGQYGSGKSHFLAYLVRLLEAKRFHAEAPRVVRLSLVNFAASLSLESIVNKAVGARSVEGDRRAVWREIRDHEPVGLVLVLDELSEFLRSKPDVRAFHEDVRFLQFLGEWAQESPFWVVAAMQEQIEHLGELEVGLYRKIKDRFRIRLILSSAHIRDLIRESVLLKGPDYSAEVQRIVLDVRKALPAQPTSDRELAEIYPVHPTTLQFLEEIRDRFSKARGAIDFVISRLAGDPTRHVPRLLDAPLGAFLTPDTIVDHFRDQFELQSEYQALAHQVLPWFREEHQALFEAPASSELAERLLKLLILVHLSPARESLSAEEAAFGLLYRASKLDPAKNVSIVNRILERFVEHGRFVVRAGTRFRLELKDDGGAEFERRFQIELRAHQGVGQEGFERLIPLLRGDRFDPTAFARDAATPRNVRWHFHDRRVSVLMGAWPEAAVEGDAICVLWPGEDPREPRPQVTIVPSAIEMNAAARELLALGALRDTPLGRDAKRRLQARFDAQLEHFRVRIRQAYAEGQVVWRSGEASLLPRLQPNSTFESMVDSVAELVFRRNYPTFARFAPTHGSLPAEAFRAFFRNVAEATPEARSESELCLVVWHGYLSPMGLASFHGSTPMLAPNLERHDLVKLILPMIEHEPAPKTLYAHLSGLGHGLVPDQVSLLLMVLVAVGEIDVLKGSKSIRETYETLPHPIHYDRVVAGSGLSLEELKDLEALCAAFSWKTPRQWTVLSERSVLGRLAEQARSECDVWHPRLLQWSEDGEVPELVRRLRAYLAPWRSLTTADSAFDGFRQFRFSVGSMGAFLAERALLQELPEKLEKTRFERNRLVHLLSHPHLRSSQNETAGGVLGALGPPPSLAAMDDLCEWLSNARTAYEAWTAEYRKAHDEYYAACARHEAHRVSLPPIAESRHLGLGAELREFRALRESTKNLPCRGISSLEFEPTCRCGFGGGSGQELRERLDRLLALERGMRSSIHGYFAQPDVKQRLKNWLKDGLESGPALQPYLDGKQAVPPITNLALFDRYMANVAVVKVLSGGDLASLLAGKAYEPNELVDVLLRHLHSVGAQRVRIEAKGPESSGVPESVIAYCIEQCLKTGQALPSDLTTDVQARALDRVVLGSVGARALSELENLGLHPKLIDLILTELLTGKLRPGAATKIGPLARAALQAADPKPITTLDEFRARARALYAAHDRLIRVAPGPWKAFVEQFHETWLPSEVPRLEEALRLHGDAQWVIVDALGLQLLDAVRDEVCALVGRPTWASLEVATVSETTTTEACYSGLIEAGIAHSFHKVNGIDDLLHADRLPFDELVQRARAELRIASKRVLPLLAAKAPVVLFADHGFRLSPDLSHYRHGGSTLIERLVPLIRFAPLP